jgi:hypothetical protein
MSFNFSPILKFLHNNLVLKFGIKEHAHFNFFHCYHFVQLSRVPWDEPMGASKYILQSFKRIEITILHNIKLKQC